MAPCRCRRARVGAPRKIVCFSPPRVARLHKNNNAQRARAAAPTTTQMSRPVAIGLALAWPLFLLGACVHAEDYWPLFNVFFLCLGVLPAVFGALSSQGLWGAIGDFTIGAVGCSLFAFPIVLRNAGVIPIGSVLLISAGNVALGASVYLLTRSM